MNEKQLVSDQAEISMEAETIRELTLEEIFAVAGGPQVTNDGGVH